MHNNKIVAFKSWLKLLWKLYKYRVINGINITIIYVIVIGVAYSAGLCYGNDCVYINETSIEPEEQRFTIKINESAGENNYYKQENQCNYATNDYLMAEKIFNWLITLAIISALLSVYKYYLRKTKQVVK